MTILVCQKRHHEPHYVTVPDVGFGVWGDRRCDGRAVWPYARPKPPRGIADLDYERYQREHRTIAILHLSCWLVYTWDGYRWAVSHSITHAEAITYAQNLVNERRKSVAD